MLVVYWTEYFAERAVGALAERVSVGCKVLVWRSSDQAADLAVGLRLGPAAVRWELVQDDTGPWLPELELQMQEGSFVLAAVLAAWWLLLQSVAEL